MKKLDELPSLGLSAAGLTSLKTIAESAGQPEVGFVVAAARRLGQDVLDFKRPEHKMLRAQAISATIAGLLPDTAANLVR
jgi:hypothetical protein